MFSLTEAAFAVLLVGVVLAGVAHYRSDLTVAGEAKRTAALYGDVHAGAQRYLEDRYPAIESCLNGPRWAMAWRAARAAAVTPADLPRNTGDFVPVPLFPVADPSAPPAAGDAAWLGAPPGAADASLGIETLADCLPSLAGAGVLPASLGVLRSDVGTWEHLYADRYDLRVVVRLVQLDPDPNAVEPVLGVQMLLAMKAPAGEPIEYRMASEVAESTALPSVGLLSSIDVAGADAESEIVGAAGAWGLQVCVEDDLDPHAGVLGVPSCSTLTAEALRDVRTLRLRSPEDPGFLALSSHPGGSVAPSERLSGAALVPSATDPAVARVVSLVHLSRSAADREFVSRFPVPGMPERMRLGGDLDLAGFGLPNTGYVTGVDTDGDGFVNQGPVLIGPPAAGEWVDSDGDGTPDVQAGFLPVTIAHDLHVRGALFVGPGPFPFDATSEDRNLQPGSVLVSSPMDGATPVEDRGSVVLHGQRVQITAFGTDADARDKSAPAFLHVAHAPDGVTADPWPTDPMVQALEVSAPTAFGGVGVFTDDAARTVGAQADGVVDVYALGAFTGGGDIVRIRSESDESHVAVSTEGVDSSVVLATFGAMSTPGAGGVRAMTDDVNSSILLETRAADSFIDQHVAETGTALGADGALRLRTSEDDAAIVASTAGAGSPVDVLTGADDSPVRFVADGATFAAHADDPDSGGAGVLALSKAGNVRVRAQRDVELSAGGAFKVEAASSEVDITGDMTVDVGGDATVRVVGALDVDVTGDATLDSVARLALNTTTLARTEIDGGPLHLNEGAHTRDTVIDGDPVEVNRASSRDTFIDGDPVEINHASGRTTRMDGNPLELNTDRVSRTEIDGSPVEINQGKTHTTSLQGSPLRLNAPNYAHITRIDGSEVRINHAPTAGHETVVRGDPLRLNDQVGGTRRTHMAFFPQDLELEASATQPQLPLSDALGGATFPDLASVDLTEQPVANRAPCPTGTTAQDLIVPTGWSRNHFAAERTIEITFRVPGYQPATAQFTVNEPYTGWSVEASPATGRDDGTSGGAPGETDFTTVRVCVF